MDMKKQFHLTKEGHKELSDELQALIDRRSLLAENIATARSKVIWPKTLNIMRPKRSKVVKKPGLKRSKTFC